MGFVPKAGRGWDKEEREEEEKEEEEDEEEKETKVQKEELKGGKVTVAVSLSKIPSASLFSCQI